MWLQRREASLDDREDCYGRAIVALIKAIQHTYYIVSPLGGDDRDTSDLAV